MKKSIPAFMFAGLLFVAGLMMLTTAGCGSTSYTTNDSDRPWNETRGFQHQGSSRLDR
jgi:hypothetical protein